MVDQDTTLAHLLHVLNARLHYHDHSCHADPPNYIDGRLPSLLAHRERRTCWLGLQEDGERSEQRGIAECNEVLPNSGAHHADKACTDEKDSYHKPSYDPCDEIVTIVLRSSAVRGAVGVSRHWVSTLGWGFFVLGGTQ